MGAGVLAILLWIVAATGLGMSWLVPAAVEWAAPEGWTVEVGDVDGAWHSRIRLRDLALDGPTTSVSVEEVVVDYNLLPLFSRTIELEEVRVVGPELTADLTASPTDTSARQEEPDTGLGPLLDGAPLGRWMLTVGALEVRQARAALTREQGSYTIADARLYGRAELGPSLAHISVDTLEAEVTPPAAGASADSQARGSVGRGRLVLQAQLQNGLLVVDTLSFESRRSRLTGKGELLLTPDPSLVDRVDFELVADPLDLRDLPIALPEAWVEQPRVVARMSARGAVDSMTLRAEADGPGATAARVDAVLRTPTDTLFEDSERRPPTLEASADVRGELSPWSLGPLNGDLTAELDLRVEGLDGSGPGTLRLTMVHRPSADPLGGLVGRDLRMGLSLTRGVASAPRRASGEDRVDAVPNAPIEGEATLYRSTTGPDDWMRVSTLTVAGTERRAEWQVDLELDRGSLTGRGSAEWAGERFGVVVDRLQTEELDASAFMGTLPATDLTALLEGRVTGASTQHLSGMVTLRVGPSSFAGTLVENATLRARLEPGLVDGGVMADVAGRRIGSDFDVALGDSMVSASFSRLHVSTPKDSVSSDGTPAVPAELEVHGSGSASWSLGPDRRGALALTLDSAFVAGLPLSDGSIEARLVGDSVVADASLRVLDVLSAPVSIDATARARGLAPASMVGRLDLSAEWLAAEATEAGASGDSLSLTVIAEQPGRFVVDGGLLAREGGGVDIDGTARVVSDTLAFDMLAVGGFRAQTRILRQATMDTIRLEASGARSDGTWEGLHAQLLVGSADWRGVTADTMRIGVSLEGDGIRVDTVAVDSEVLMLAGGGTLPHGAAGPGRLDFRASFDLEPLEDALEAGIPRFGENAMVAAVTGTTDSLAVSAELEIASVSYGSVEVADLAAQVGAVVEPGSDAQMGITTAVVDLELDAIALPEADVQNLTATLGGSPDSLRLEMSARVDDARTGELVASIDPRPEARSVSIERLQLQLDEDEWSLADPARISYADGYELRSFLLAAEEQSIRMDGGVTGGGALDLTVEVDSTRVGTVSDLLGLPRLRGWLSGMLRLHGTIDAPRGVAEARAGFHTLGRPPTTADVHLETEGGRLLTSAALRDPTGGTVTLEGSLPLNGREAVPSGAAAGTPTATAERDGLALEISADAFDVSSTLPFVDQALLATLEGRVDASLEVGGSLDAPRLHGPVDLSSGRARLPQLGVTWEEVRLHARGEGAQLVVDSARARAGGGHVALEGTVSFADSVVALDLGASMEEFQAIQSAEYRAVVSGDLRMDGTLGQPVVEGDVQVVSVDVYLGETAAATDLMDVELSEEDLETLRDRFGYVPASADEDASATELLTADLTIELSRDSWLRKRTSPEMAVAFTGEVEVQLRPGAEPHVQGSVTTIAGRGYVQQFGKRFTLREGTVTLDGPPESARVDLAATYTIPSRSNPDAAEATIILSVEGTQDDLALTLSSEPPMENADIVSYVATGRPAASYLALGGTADQGGEDSEGGLAVAGAGIALDQIVGAVERAAREGVGLDVVEIRREGVRSATLAAGKYLSPKLYVGFAQPVTHLEGDGLSLGDESESEVEIEYQLLRRLLLNIEGSNSALRIFMRGNFAY